MPPLFPEHPLAAVTTCERTSTAELQTGGALETEHLVKRPVHQFPAEAIRIEILNRRARTIGNDLMFIAPGDTVHGFKALVVFDGLDEFNDGLFAFAADDEIYFAAFAQDALIGVRWIDATVNNFDVWVGGFDLVNGFEGGLVRGG